MVEMLSIPRVLFQPQTSPSSLISQQAHYEPPPAINNRYLSNKPHWPEAFETTRMIFFGYKNQMLNMHTPAGFKLSWGDAPRHPALHVRRLGRERRRSVVCAQLSRNYCVAPRILSQNGNG